MSIKKKVVLPLILAGALATTTGCVKPYDTPEFVEIEANQTAFVIPLEGATSDQQKFESVKYLEEMQVATKRIKINHKWVQTGRWRHQGEYMDTTRVLVVDRTPVNREWFNDASRSSSGKSQGFIGESKDSIKFKIGLTATAKVEEANTAKFLYQYRGKNLATIMDTEVRNKLGTLLLEKYGTMNMEEIRGNKREVIDYVRGEAVPYFEKFGITLQNIGYVGDLEYVDPKVQQSINKEFNALQEKKAQDVINKKNEDQAQSELVQAQKKAQAMKTLEAMKELEIQEEIAKGLANGNIKLPEVLVIGDNDGMLFNLPLDGLKSSK